MARRNISIVHWFPELEKHKCGYCKQLNTNCSYGMWAESLTVDDYQNLIDRGWRRSGKYCYKPVMDITCCPLYTIRCEALKIKLSKSQKKIIKRVNNYLSGFSKETGQNVAMDLSNQDIISMPMASDFVSKENPNKIDLDKINTSQIENISKDRSVNELASNTCSKIDEKDTVEAAKLVKMSTSTSSLVAKDHKPGKGADPSKPPCKKAKLIRLERKQQKLAAKGIMISAKTDTKSESNTQEKSLEQFITDVSKTPAHRLKVRLVLTTGSKKDRNEILAQEHPIYSKYQMTVHGDSQEKCSEKQFSGFLLESPLQIVLKHMHVNDPTFKESAVLYSKYQINIHDDHECGETAFEEFLVDTPLEHWATTDGPSCGYGSFHQQYWLDDKLIAVGVIDILPKCVSSVYFFYDPDYRNLTLGTYGSLRELYFVRQLNNLVPDIKYYYMGFYIHSCPKMRYKANLNPSFLLCPETYVWFPIEKCVPKLDKEKYSRFNDDIDAKDENGCFSSSDVDQLMIVLGYKGCVPYKYYKEKVRDNEQDYIRFGNFIGKKNVSQILLIARNEGFD